MIVEPLIEAAALVAGISWLFCTIRRTATTRRDLVRLTCASTGIAIVIALVLEYARLELPERMPRSATDLGAALLLLIVGIAWLRPAILLSTGLHLRPSLTSFVPPLKHYPPPDLSSTSLMRHRRDTWPLTGLAAGVLVAALNNGDQPVRASMTVSVALLLVSCWIAIGLAGRRVVATNSILRIIAGSLLAALGSFQISEILALEWRHPASVLWALVAAYLVTTYWLIETCHDGEPKYPRPTPLDAISSPRLSRIPASTRSRNVLATVEVCLWTAALALCVHFGWHQAIGMMDWQAGGLLFAGFILVLVHSILVDVRLPGGG
ncbi:hypothetical protein AWB81_04737 [Caballeronia arationis]|nr:hypothetical protein AWB81_04737 [Caballeronia arationis]